MARKRREATNYVAVSAGACVAGGGTVGTLRNQHGVIIDGLSTEQGPRVTLAASVTLAGQ